MIKALVLKELKETAWIWLFAAVVFLLFVLSSARVPNVPFFASPGDEIPFVTSRIAERAAVLAAFLAVSLGLWQSYGETWRGTYSPLLNLPISRRKLFAVKVAVGLGLTWGLAGIALAVVCFWAAMPGTHASPFEWSMTAQSWQVWLVVSVLYLGGFATGLYPARWLGPRLLPLVAAMFVFSNLKQAGESPNFPLLAFIALVLMTNGVYLVALEYLTRTRDFS